MFLPLHLPSNVTVRYVGYGLPRVSVVPVASLKMFLLLTTRGYEKVGNEAWADYVDAQGHSVTHINNLEDPVPILPPILLGYRHPNGEVHIEESGEWASCPGAFRPSQHPDTSRAPSGPEGHRGCLLTTIPDVYRSGQLQ